MSKETLYFVFDADVHRRHMGLGARIVGQGELTDYRLGFCGDVATLVPCKGRKVQGMIWALSLEMEKAMDWKKGYQDGIYEKQEVMVRGKYGQEYMVMAYIPDRIAAMHHALPSAEYFGRMVEGYCQHGLQTQGLFESLKDTHRDLMAAEDRLRRVNMGRKKQRATETSLGSYQANEAIFYTKGGTTRWIERNDCMNAFASMQSKRIMSIWRE